MLFIGSWVVQSWTQADLKLCIPPHFCFNMKAWIMDSQCGQVMIYRPTASFFREDNRTIEDKWHSHKEWQSQHKSSVLIPGVEYFVLHFGESLNLNLFPNLNLSLPLPPSLFSLFTVKLDFHGMIIHVVKELKQLCLYLKTILFIWMGSWNKCFQKFSRNRLLASFCKADCKTAGNLLQKFTGNFAIWCKLVFIPIQASKSKRKHKLEWVTSWKLVGGRETTAGLFQRSRKDTATCLHTYTILL